MNNQSNQIETIIEQLFNDSKNDYRKMGRAFAKRIIRPLQPKDFEKVYLSISKEQGEDLRRLIIDRKLRKIVEFGTSFGISTLYMAQAAREIGGSVLTTELLESKALKASENFRSAGVDEMIELRVGNAIETLKGYSEKVDLLFLDGWKNQYLAVFELLEPNFHANTVIYVDNADMTGTKIFLDKISSKNKYSFHSIHDGKVVLVSKA